MKMTIDNKSSTGSMVYFLRHAEKDIFKLVSNDSEIPLTALGHEKASNFGKHLQSGFQVLNSIRTSPLKRCMQTATSIVQGYASDVIITPCNLLGDPGIFVSEPDLAGEHFEQKSVYEVVTEQLNGRELSGFAQLDSAAARLLRQFACDINHAGELSLYISHDSILCLFLGALIERCVKESEWLSYLDGFAIENTASQYILYWNAEKLNITERVNYLLSVE